jgi:hypothetical protein
MYYDEQKKTHHNFKFNDIIFCRSDAMLSDDGFYYLDAWPGMQRNTAKLFFFTSTHKSEYMFVHLVAFCTFSDYEYVL